MVLSSWRNSSATAPRSLGWRRWRQIHLSTNPVPSPGAAARRRERPMCSDAAPASPDCSRGYPGCWCQGRHALCGPQHRLGYPAGRGSICKGRAGTHRAMPDTASGASQGRGAARRSTGCRSVIPRLFGQPSESPPGGIRTQIRQTETNFHRVLPFLAAWKPPFYRNSDSLSTVSCVIRP